jgi:ribosomal protein S18 acetylase RimI-like enzyme
MEVVIARAAIEDTPELIAVQDLAFAEEFERYGECPSFRESPDAMAEMIANAIVYKITVDGRIVGDAIVRQREDGSRYLRTISVIPACQGLGIGARAIEFMESDNPDAARWRLITPAGSPRNRHFYEKLGYRVVGEHRRSERLTLIEYEKILR